MDLGLRAAEIQGILQREIGQPIEGAEPRYDDPAEIARNVAQLLAPHIESIIIQNNRRITSQLREFGVSIPF